MYTERISYSNIGIHESERFSLGTKVSFFLRIRLIWISELVKIDLNRFSYIGPLT